MLTKLQVINLPSGLDTGKNEGEVFTLSTCQRTVVLGLNNMPLYGLKTICNEMQVFNGQAGYQYLLEIICGLQSRLTGENEIVAQVKEAYDNYKKLPKKNTHIMSIIEKLLKDAKEIRTKHLVEIGQQSYAGITKKIIDSQNYNGPILILGSGKLAKDVLTSLSKRNHIYLSARNEIKVRELCNLFSIEFVDWRDIERYQSFPYIVNTIGADEIVFYDEFFDGWDIITNPNKAFIDLGSPSIIETLRGPEQGVHLLEDVFKFGNQLDSKKEVKIGMAKQEIEKLVSKRLNSFSVHYPFGWEDLHLV